METKHCAAIGMEMPKSFQCEAYSSVLQHVVSRIPHQKYSRLSNYFAGAWNGLAYRYRACAELDEEFKQSLIPYEGYEEKYLQSKILFAFFTSAVSVIDCYSLAITVVGMHSAGKDSAFEDPKYVRGINSGSLRQLLLTGYPSELITLSVSSLLSNKSKEFETIVALRNLLAHRAVPPRKYYLGGDKGGKVELGVTAHSEFDVDIAIVPELTANYFSWLALTMDELFTKTDEFVKNVLP